MKSHLFWRKAALPVFYIGMGVCSGLVWARIANLPALPSWHIDMIGGTAPAPNQYRPLTPWLAEGIRRLLAGGDLFFAYVLLRGFITGITLYVFDRYLRVWFDPSAALAGALALGAILPFTYLRVVQESDPVNLLAFVLAFWAMARGRDLWLIPIVLVGTLNRETAALIPALYLAGRLGERPPGRVLAQSMILGLCWVVVYGTLRAAYGHREYYCPVIMWSHNVSSWGPTIFMLLLFGPLWLLAVLGVRAGAPVLLRRALLLLPAYIALHYVVAMVNEVRLFLPFAPVIIPLSWWALFPEARSNRPPESGKMGGRRKP